MSVDGFKGVDDTISLRNTTAYFDISADTSVQIEPWQRSIVGQITGSSVVLTVTLPPCAQCAGHWFSVHKKNADGTMAVNDQGDDGRINSQNLTNAHQKRMYYSDGTVWYTVPMG